MACNCGKKKTPGVPRIWVHTTPGGVQTSYSSEQDARMAMAREGGTIK